MMSIRQALVEYLDIVRKFAFEIASISSGVYDTDSPGKVLQNPILWVQKEADWIDELLEALDIIQKYVELVRRWANHVFGIAHNLGITDIEITKVERKQTSIAALLKMKSFDQDYLKWVLADISQEVDRLILPTQQLIEKAPHLLELTDQFRGFFMENVKKIVLAWTGQNLEELYNRLIEVLDAAHGSENPKTSLKYIGTYCDIIFQVAFSTPMLIGESTTTAFSPKRMKTSQSRVDQIIEGIHDLREFVRLRKQAYLRFLQHLEVLIQAVLPPNTSIIDWVGNFVIEPSKTADDVLPAQISTDTLTLAIRQAEEANNDWEAISELLIPLRKGAHKLKELLQSPTLTEFLNADQSRRELTNKWRRKLESKFKTLRKAVLQ